MRFYILTLIFSLLVFSLSGQVKNLGVPQVINYSKEIYSADAQNWAILQDERGVLYFGNNTAVLEFDGNQWKKHFTSNKSAVKSLARDKNGRIYVGGKAEFGYLKANTKGEWQYISLVDSVAQKYRKFKDVWQIFETKNGVCFKTPEMVYLYKNGQFSVLPAETSFSLSFLVNGEFYVKEDEIGIKVLKNGELVLIPESEQFAKESIRGMIPYGKKILMITWSQGFWLFDGEKFEKLKTPIDDFVDKNKIYCAIPLKNNYLAFGTFSNGVLVVDNNFNPVQLINSQKGLQNDKVLNMFFDNQENLWLALGNGISSIQITSPFSTFDERYGLNSATYSSIIFQNKLYIGNSNGVFYTNWKNQSALSNFEQFKPIEHSAGQFQAWNLDTANGVLLCGSMIGIFSIKNNKTENISNKKDVYTFLPLKNKPNTLLVGARNGLGIMIFKNNKWHYSHDIKGFNETCRYLQLDQQHIWVSEKTKGIYRLKLNASLDSVVETKFFDTKSGLPTNLKNTVFKWQNEIVVGTEKGIFRYEKNKDTFVIFKELSRYIGDLTIHDLLVDNYSNIWFCGYKTLNKEKQTIELCGKFHYSKNDSTKNKRIVFGKFINKIKAVTPIAKNELLFYTDKGFIHFDQSIEKNFLQSYFAHIRKIEFLAKDSTLFYGNFYHPQNDFSLTQLRKEIPKIDYDFNGLLFTFSACFYEDADRVKYKYFLEGDDAGWSEWKDKNFKEYSNLPSGKYTFHLKALNIYDNESEETKFSFIILSPWYLTVWAFIGYIIIMAFIIWGIVKLSVKRLEKQKEHLEKVVAQRTEKIAFQNAELNQQKEEIMSQRDILFEQNEMIKEKNKSITASITYAKRIQEAMLPFEKRIAEFIPEHFILFKPRDIVSGDFYWFTEKNGKIVFTAVDCTGHGVPGAFMSMIGSQILTNIIYEGILEADEILNTQSRHIRHALKQEETDNQDGMDMALCVIDLEKKILQFAGAKNPLIYIQNGELNECKPDKIGIGGKKIVEKDKFTKHEISFETPICFYIFSDGYEDQFGGSQKRKFMAKQLKKILLEIHTLPMHTQKMILNSIIERWKQGHDVIFPVANFYTDPILNSKTETEEKTEQTDDILLIGFKLC